MDLGWAVTPVTVSLYDRGDWRHMETQRRRLREDSRDWSGVTISQGRPGAPEIGRGREDSLPEPSEAAWL